MAKLYGEIAAKALLTLDKSFARANGQPLDASEVYYSLDAAKAYAATAQAYIGQKIVVVEEGVVTHYSVEDAAGNLKELGSKPVGDNTSIVVAEDGTVSLKGVGSLVFERDILGEDGEPTGEKEAVQYQPLMTAAGLVWVEPSKTTVEGLATLIDALSVRVKAIEDDYVDAAELAAAVKVETDRATGAEEALSGRVKAIEDDYLKIADKYDDTALAARVKAIEDDYLVEADKYDDTEVVGRIAAIEEDYLKAKDKYDDSAIKNRIEVIEGDYLKAADIANMATKSDVEAAIADEAEARDEAIEGLQDQINLIMNNPDTEGVINSINEFTQYIADHGEIAEGFRTDINNNAQAIAAEVKRAGEAETELSDRIDVLEAIDHDAYVAADTALEGKLNDAIALKADASALTAAVSDLESAIALKANASEVAESVEALEGAIATAKSEAIADAATAAAGIYATKAAMGELETDINGRLDTLEAINHDLYATKAELEAHETAAAAAYATKDELKVTDDKAVNNTTAISNLTSRLDGIVAQGGEPNVINNIKVNGQVQTIVDKAVDIKVPTKFSDISDDSGFSDLITAAQNAANAAQSTADSAASAANKAQGEVDALELTVGEIQTTIAGHTASIADHAGRIAALETADSTHAAEYEILKGLVNDNAAAIATKADQTALVAANTKISANETAIKAINETTIPAINGEIAKKANAADVYTKAEIGTITDGKTITKMIEDAQAAATYNDEEVRGLIADNADAIAAEADRADKAEKANKALIDENAANIAANGLLIAANIEAIATNAANIQSNAAAIDLLTNGVGDDKIDSVNDLIAYVTEHGAEVTGMQADIATNAADIAAIYDVDENGVKSGTLVNEISRVEGLISDNSALIAAINNAETGILAAAKKYTDDSIAGLPAATAEALGLVKYDDSTIMMNENKQLYVAKVSTDILEQGAQELVLNGGSAKE